MVRKLAGVVFAVSALHASVVSALGLGELELKSGLNQPLQAEIALNNLGDLNQQQISVKLAGADDFNRAGVERILFLSNLKFTVQFDGKGSVSSRLAPANWCASPTWILFSKHAGLRVACFASTPCWLIYPRSRKKRLPRRRQRYPARRRQARSR